MDWALAGKVTRQALQFGGGFGVAAGIYSAAQLSTAVNDVMTIGAAAVSLITFGTAVYRHYVPAKK